MNHDSVRSESPTNDRPTSEPGTRDDETSDVSVVICSYTFDRWDVMCRCVDSALAQVPPVREVILVIDHNEELEVAARDRFPDVVIATNAGSQGVSSARNTGVELARGAFVAFLDDDATAEPDWIASLLPAFADPTVLGVDSRLEPVWLGTRPAWFPEEFLWVVGCSYLGLPTELGQVRNLIGAAMVMRRDVFRSIGGFRTELGRIGRIPVGCEETELSIRATNHQPGSRVLHEPASVVRHEVPATRSTLRYFLHRCAAEGRSKAVMSRLVGARDGLSAEVRYTTRVLPLGIGRALLGCLRPGSTPRAGHAGRAGAIVAGALWTAGGYVVARLTARRLSTP